ncbi:MAG: hypothetical protein U1F43_12800 [Myxococcota bacterium]
MKKARPGTPKKAWMAATGPTCQKAWPRLHGKMTGQAHSTTTKASATATSCKAGARAAVARRTGSLSARKTPSAMPCHAA